jgi:hypothetical protein
MGWALVGLPVSLSLLGLFLPVQIGVITGLVCVVGSCVLIAIDAKRLGQSALRHVLFAALLWAIGFPVYMRRRALWGPPSRLAFAIVAVVLFGGLPFVRPFVLRDRASVRCAWVGTTVDEGLDCTLEHTQGFSPLHACWDVVLTCANGPGESAHACGAVSPGAFSHVAVRGSDFAGAQGCDRFTKVEIKNVVAKY